jgi:hypothetical protein
MTFNKIAEHNGESMDLLKIERGSKSVSSLTAY